MSAWSGVAWARPEWLVVGGVLVLAAVAALVWALRRRSRSLTDFAEPEVRERTQALGGRGRLARAALLVLGLAGISVAIAGPRWGIERVESPPVSQRVVFALDVSRSMLAGDVGASRLEASRRAIRRILAGLPGAEAGLVAFAGEATLAVPLTRDVAAIDLYLDSVGPDWISDPSTDLANAVAVSLDAFGPAEAPGRAVVVLSDGEDHAGGVEGVTGAARERDVEVEAIGVGTEAGARIPVAGGGWLESGGEVVVTRLDPEPLRALAEGTGGAYAALSADDAAVGTILARLRALQTEETSRTASERRADRYRWPLALGVLALALEAGLRLASRRRLDPATAVILAVALLGMGRAATPREAYEEGRYQEALVAWRAADRSEGAGPIEAYGRASAAYRLGNYREAAASYAVAARTAEEPARVADAWYNAGNGRYRRAQAVETERGPAEAEAYWDAAVDAYREALLVDPDDADAKHNLELALRRREESGGGGAGGGGGGGGEQGGGGGGRGVQPPSSGTGDRPDRMSRSQAERLLDALAARERDALAGGEEERRAAPPQSPGW